MSYRIQIVSIEGNIGSGKSTLLAHMKDTLCNKNNTYIVYLPEPVNEWATIQDKEGKPILTKFYEDPEKYGFSFQCMAFITRLKILKKTVEQIKEAEELVGGNNVRWIIVTERSLQTDRNVFAKMLYDAEKIEHVNYQIYLNFYD